MIVDLVVKSQDVVRGPDGHIIVKDRRAAHQAAVIMFVDDENNNDTFIIKNRYGSTGRFDDTI